MFLADMHIHSTFSDGQMAIPEIVDFYGRRGFGAIAITDHLCEEKTWLGKAARYLDYTLTPETFPIYMELLQAEAERAWDQYKMVVIPGYEISKNSISNARSAHILGLGVTDYVAADKDAVDIAKQLQNQGALTVAAHPVSTRKIEAQTYYLWDRRHELDPYFDAWEVASGAILFDEVVESGLPMLANSDLHRPQQIHAWKTVFQCERQQEAILEAVRKQNVEFKFYSEERIHATEPVASFPGLPVLNLLSVGIPSYFDHSSTKVVTCENESAPPSKSSTRVL